MNSVYDLTGITTSELDELIRHDLPVVILLPLGSVEPHGPHLSLLTDTMISQSCAQLAAARLNDHRVHALIAPAIPYGVTDCATGFTGAISVPPVALIEYISAVVSGFLAAGVEQVCLINNHLEPAHFDAVRKVKKRFEPAQVSIACPLIRRWGRTLSDEFKQGECHAGRYETAIILEANPEGVKESIQQQLPEVPVSLSEKLSQGISDFKSMGLDQAYAGAPALATREEGQWLLDKLTDMVVTEVREHLEMNTTVSGRD